MTWTSLKTDKYQSWDNNGMYLQAFLISTFFSTRFWGLCFRKQLSKSHAPSTSISQSHDALLCSLLIINNFDSLLLIFLFLGSTLRTDCLWKLTDRSFSKGKNTLVQNFRGDLIAQRCLDYLTNMKYLCFSYSNISLEWPESRHLSFVRKTALRQITDLRGIQISLGQLKMLCFSSQCWQFLKAHSSQRACSESKNCLANSQSAWHSRSERYSSV